MISFNTFFAAFKSWWPGWQGEKKGRPLSLDENYMGITMQRKFRYVKPSQSQPRLIDYYFWALESLNSRLPYICEKRQKNIGCIEGNGENYQGIADRGESGIKCQSWNSTYLSMVLDDDKIKNLGDLNTNYCRNPDGDVAPWCIAPNGEFDY